jgi:uncharacterized protein YndB with AHSA1/START domain
MAEESGPADDRLVVRRIIRATCEEVFAAWSDPESISQWMCPGSVKSAEAQLDVRVGGKFRIVMKDGEREFDHTGEYRVVQRPSKLVFTWVSKGTDNQPTMVTVEMRALGDSCELTLTHEKLATSDARNRHEKGWSDIVNKLGAHLEREVQAG